MKGKLKIILPVVLILLAGGGGAYLFLLAAQAGQGRAAEDRRERSFRSRPSSSST